MITPEIEAYSHRIAESFRHWTGNDFITPVDSERLAHRLYHAPFAMLAHGMGPDPVFTYANLTAQELWGMDWQRFTQTPSRLSAEEDARDERARLLALAESQGFFDNYTGVRINASGKRFTIKDCMVWNLVDEQGQRIGQAACFTDWEWL